MKIAILLHGTESEKPKLTVIIDKLQAQLNKIDSEDVEVVYSINEESIEEKKNWLLSQTESNKYVFIDAETDIPDNFLLLRFNSVKNGHPVNKLIKLGVYSK